MVFRMKKNTTRRYLERVFTMRVHIKDKCLPIDGTQKVCKSLHTGHGWKLQTLNAINLDSMFVHQYVLSHRGANEMLNANSTVCMFILVRKKIKQEFIRDAVEQKENGNQMDIVHIRNQTDLPAASKSKSKDLTQK